MIYITEENKIRVMIRVFDHRNKRHMQFLGKES